MKDKGNTLNLTTLNADTKNEPNTRRTRDLQAEHLQAQNSQRSGSIVILSLFFFHLKDGGIISIRSHGETTTRW